MGLMQRVDLSHERCGGLRDGCGYLGCPRLGRGQPSLQRLYLLAQQILSSRGLLAQVGKGGAQLLHSESESRLALVSAPELVVESVLGLRPRLV
jgi:hypothetical protein